MTGTGNRMRYVSTRGAAPPQDFTGVLMTGLAPDGGLFLPESWPSLPASGWASLAGLPYAEAAARVLAPFTAGDLAPGVLERLTAEAYAGFDHATVCPLVQIGPSRWLLELFHGPTLAFKDLAMQLLGRLFDHVLTARGERMTIVGATSGDTGSAAIEACRGRDAIDIFILHPHERTSEVQRRQMTCVTDGNVHNIAIRGTFDDCQALVKAMFNDAAFRDRLRLSAVNSINWARVMAQVVYYATSAVALGAPGRPVRFAVPTGNFGDIFAGYTAARMGLPVAGLTVATNSNDILARAFADGSYRKGEVARTMSPSMDIQVSSNFERLLFDACGRDGARIAALMAQLDSDGGFDIGSALRDGASLFSAVAVDEGETLETIAGVHRDTGLLIDPHTAVGVAAAARQAAPAGDPVVVLSTAHPAKFPDAVARATGLRPDLPPRLADLYDRAERFDVLDADLGTVEAHIAQRARVVRE